LKGTIWLAGSGDQVDLEKQGKTRRIEVSTPVWGEGSVDILRAGKKKNDTSVCENLSGGGVVTTRYTLKKEIPEGCARCTGHVPKGFCLIREKSSSGVGKTASY